MYVTKVLKIKQKDRFLITKAYLGRNDAVFRHAGPSLVLVLVHDSCPDAVDICGVGS